MAIESVNPYTGRTERKFDAFSWAETEHILADAHAAFATWRTTDFAHRTQLMHRAAELLRERADELARLMAVEMGKPLADGRAEANKCALCCDFYADRAAEFLADEFIETEAQRSFIAYEPLGAVLAVMPWNFPFWQVVRFAAPALMAATWACSSTPLTCRSARWPSKKSFTTRAFRPPRSARCSSAPIWWKN
ncbi:aldehyde dehydrogenase family protein [Hymenobacter lapidiphilus]|uniref:aldehyde dehydrogenase family protein n=1 Tax=Hymenobacter sp. CCM 8763 TaxID=2303334 RepID=UPI0026BA1504|nr:aldehyde dehydrogenase family protein [Hymenobacter sp. CCM 8763]